MENYFYKKNELKWRISQYHRKHTCRQRMGIASLHIARWRMFGTVLSGGNSIGTGWMPP